MKSHGAAWKDAPLGENRIGMDTEMYMVRTAVWEKAGNDWQMG